MISGLAVDDEMMKGDKNKMHTDYVSRIKNNRLKLMRHKILAEMREAEMSHDHNRLEELKEKFNQLIKI